MSDMLVANITGVFIEFASLECLAAILFDEILLVCSYTYVIHADADSPTGEVVLAAAWARSEYDTGEDPATEDPDVPPFTQASWGPAHRCPWGREAVFASSATAAGNPHLAAGSATGSSRRPTAGRVSLA